MTQDRSQQPPMLLQQDEDPGTEVPKPQGPPIPFAAPRPPMPSFSSLAAPPLPPGSQGVPVQEDTLEELDDSEEEMLPTETMSFQEVEEAALTFGAQPYTPAPGPLPGEGGLSEISESDLIEEAATQVREPLYRSGHHPQAPPHSP